MGIIYKITNKQNNFSYIGKTSRNFKTRLSEHLRDAYEEMAKETCNPESFHKALIDFGKDNFTYEILENNIPNSELDKKEQYYINKYDTYKNGYNQTNGGDGGRVWSKLTEEEVEQIKQKLKDVNNLESLSSIAKHYNINESVISNINTGNTWYDENIDYPIRKYDVTGLSIPKKIYNDIIIDLYDDTLLLKDIRKKYNLSEDQMTAINQGKYCYNGKHNYYKDVFSGPFPIRKDERQKIINQNEFIPMFYDVLFTDLSMAKIGKKHGIQGNTLAYICRGNRRKELTSNFILPMRQNIEENKKIFLSLYPEYKDKGGD